MAGKKSLLTGVPPAAYAITTSLSRPSTSPRVSQASCASTTSIAAYLIAWPSSPLLYSSRRRAASRPRSLDPPHRAQFSSPGLARPSATGIDSCPTVGASLPPFFLSMQPALAPAPHPSMQTSAQDHADQVLHDQLLAAHQHLSHPQQARPQAPATQPPHMQPNSASPRDQNNIDPAISGAAMLSGPPQTPPQPEPTSQESPKTYGKRPLSTSKRAAQNRAAQRAFRQRKESYIRKLEEQVKQFDSMADDNKALQAENYQLREYIINLQTRLLDSQGEVPELPSNIDLSQPRADLSVGVTGTTTGGASSAGGPSGAPQQNQAPNQGGAPNDDMNSLNRIAVAGLGMRKHPNDEANYLGNNFQARRRPDENQPGSTDTKQEPDGLPVVS